MKELLRIKSLARLKSTSLLLSLSLFSLSSCKTAQAPPLISVKTAVIKNKEFKDYISQEGVLTNRTAVLITPEDAGHVVKVLVSEGQRVKRGQTLIVLRHDKESAMLDTAKAKMNEAKIQAKRYTWLAKKGAVSQEKAEQMRLSYRTDTNEYKEKAVNLSYKYLKSPQDGTIGPLDLINEGTYLSPTQDTGIYVINNQNLWVDMTVPATQANEIKLGQPVEVFYRNSPNMIAARGVITFISPVFNYSSSTSTVLNTLKVRANFSIFDGEFRPLQYVKTSIITGRKEMPAVPASAVMMIAQKPFVYKVISVGNYLKDNKQVEKEQTRLKSLPSSTMITIQTPIKIGDLQNESFPVIKGLRVGDQIAITNTKILSNGVPINIQSTNQK